jgi:protein translocase SecG subunit
MVLVLVQKGHGAATFPGSDSGHTLLGTKTAEALTWATASTFGLFLVLAVLLNRMVG